MPDNDRIQLTGIKGIQSFGIGMRFGQKGRRFSSGGLNCMIEGPGETLLPTVDLLLKLSRQFQTKSFQPVGQFPFKGGVPTADVPFRRHDIGQEIVTHGALHGRQAAKERNGSRRG